DTPCGGTGYSAHTFGATPVPQADHLLPCQAVEIHRRVRVEHRHDAALGKRKKVFNCKRQYLQIGDGNAARPDLPSSVDGAAQPPHGWRSGIPCHGHSAINAKSNKTQ
ncbi:MAG TPA: hypothetical protein VEC06_10955, partial [Paucimonas sp.]|nr:hypothetical protein [Paucimonas sp.]